MGILSKLKGKQIGKRILLGVMDSVPVVNTIKQNIESKEGGEGAPDYWRLATTIIIAGLLVAFIAGWISMEQLEKLIELIK